MFTAMVMAITAELGSAVIVSGGKTFTFSMKSAYLQLYAVCFLSSHNQLDDHPAYLSSHGVSC